MIIAIDVGNTNIVVGCLDENKKYFEGRISTDKNATAEEYAIRFKMLFDLYKIETADIEGAIVSTVVPQLVNALKQAVFLTIGKEPVIVGPVVKTGLNIKIDNPGELGADLVVGSVAAINKYPLPQIVIDLGTATTVSVIDKNACYRGGLILTGVKTSLNALASGTSQLPNVEITAPDKIIATNTIDCMKSGSVFGTACMIDGLISRIENELGEKTTVIATGGIANCILPHCKSEIIYDDDLLLDGLMMIYNKNK